MRIRCTLSIKIFMRAASLGNITDIKWAQFVVWTTGYWSSCSLGAKFVVPITWLHEVFELGDLWSWILGELILITLDFYKSSLVMVSNCNTLIVSFQLSRVCFWQYAWRTLLLYLLCRWRVYVTVISRRLCQGIGLGLNRLDFFLNPGYPTDHRGWKCMQTLPKGKQLAI